MTTAIKRRRGTTAEHSTFIGLEGEITIDSTKDTVVVHDGATAGGFPLAKENMTGNLTFTDNAKAIFGAGSDLQIYHDGSNSYIDDAGVGDLNIRANNLYLQKYTGETYINAVADGAVGIYHNGAKKFSTTSTGIDVTGTVVSDGLTVVKTTDTQGSFSGWSVVGANGSSGAIELGANSAYQGLISYAADGNTRFLFDNSYSSTGATFEWRTNTAATARTHLKITGGGDISFYEDTGTTAKFFWDASAESLGIGTSSPLTDAGVNLDIQGGSANSRLRLGTNAEQWKWISRADNSRLELYNDTGLVLAHDSAGNLGLGVTPSAWNTLTTMQVKNASFSGFGNHSYVMANTYYNTGWKYIASEYALQYYQNATNGAHTWYTAPSGTAGNPITFTQAMTLDASGVLLVGKTSSDFGATAGFELNASIDKLYVTRSAGSTTAFNRLSTDGEIVGFAKDGTTVGSIGAISGDTYIQTNGYGIRFTDAASAIRPCNSTGGANTAMDIGDATVPWRNLYLSGGVYVGGTGAANHLDDYEEGTWTPVIEGSTSAGSYTYTNGYGYYTKIGQQVTITFNLTNITQVSAGTGYMQIKGLPFTKSAGVTHNGSVKLTSATLSAGTTWCTLEFITGSASSIIYVLQMGSGSAGVDFPVSSISSGATDVTGTITYIV